MTKITLMVDFAIESIFFEYKDLSDTFESQMLSANQIRDLMKEDKQHKIPLIMKYSYMIISVFYTSMEMAENSFYDQRVEDYCSWLLENFAKKCGHLFKDDVEFYVITQDQTVRHNRKLINRI